MRREVGGPRGGRIRRRWTALAGRVTLLGVSAAAMAGGLVVLAPRPVAASSTVLAPGKVESIPSPAIRMIPGGPVRGPHVAGTVTGVAWVPRVTADGRTLSAPSSYRLVVFGLQLTRPTADVGPMAPSWAAVTVSLDNKGASWPVDIIAIDTQIEASSDSTGTGQATYVASVTVPLRSAELTVAHDGITSQFDLATPLPSGGPCSTGRRPPRRWC